MTPAGLKRSAVGLVSAALLVSLSAPVLSQGIVGSAHDFRSGNAWYTSDEICVICHTPHNAQTVDGAPLWNHQLTQQTFTLYSSPTLDATPTQPTGNTKLCLSCHDGTVAVDSFGGVQGTVKFPQWHNHAVGGNGELQDDHPVSFVYDSALASADGELANPATQATPMGGTIQEEMLFGGKMECATCHDVHDKAGNTRILRIPNTNSALCLTCHEK